MASAGPYRADRLAFVERAGEEPASDFGETVMHKCFDAVNEKLAERNTRIMFPLMLGADQTERPMIVTEQIETGRGKQKAVGVFAAFCPFCGEALNKEPLA
jgi:hypothetical protein